MPPAVTNNRKMPLSQLQPAAHSSGSPVSTERKTHQITPGVSKLSLNIMLGIMIFAANVLFIAQCRCNYLHDIFLNGNRIKPDWLWDMSVAQGTCLYVYFARNRLLSLVSLGLSQACHEPNSNTVKNHHCGNTCILRKPPPLMALHLCYLEKNNWQHWA